MIRQPAVAGQFYPSDSRQLVASIRGFIHPNTEKDRVIGAVIPHAGYMYSGHVAGAVYARMEIPNRVIVLCPNHTGLGPPLSIMRTGAWKTPLGQIAIDNSICDALMAGDPQLTDDLSAHRYEHAVE